MFERLSLTIKSGMDEFLELVEKYENPGAKASKIKEIEHEADKITHNTFERLNKTFITPLDREDIHALLKKMDSVLDLIDGAAQRLYDYEITTPIEGFKKLVRVLNKTVSEMNDLIFSIRNIKKVELIFEKCVNINTLENEGDFIIRSEVANLFRSCQDIKLLIKWKEIFEIVETAIDMCEDVANIVEGIMLKKG